MDELKDLVEELEHENEQLKQEKKELLECLQDLLDAHYGLEDWDKTEQLIKKYKG